MRDLILKMSVSLDGFVAGPNGEADWVFRTGSDDARDWSFATVSRAGLHAVGGRTFQAMAAFYPTSDIVFAPPMNDIPKVVFTRGGLDLPAGAPEAAEGSWTNPVVADGDIVAEVSKLKSQAGGVIVAHGGAGFAQSLAAHGLIDEYRLLVHPVALGDGMPLFPKASMPINLRLVSAEPFSGGSVALVYRPG